MSKIFIDTNILVYSMDSRDKKKRDLCRLLLTDLRHNHIGVISTQVMQEFYVVATTKLRADPLMVKNILDSFRHFEVVIINPDLIKDAIDCSIVHQLSFWDALIVSAAEHSRCHQLWTEDLSAGQIIQGVQIVNPIVKISKKKR